MTDLASSEYKIDIKKINLDAFREQSGVVPQDVFLFSDSIANNLKLGSYAKNLSKETRAKLTGVAKTVYDTIAGPAQK